MATTEHSKVTVPMVERLDKALADIHAATTPARILRHLVSAVKTETNVTATAYLFDSYGQPGLVDESKVKPGLRGNITYPDLVTGAGLTVPAADETSPPVNYDLVMDGQKLGGLVALETPADEVVLRILLREAASSLARHKLTSETRTRLAEVQALQRITQALTRSLEFDKVADTLLTHTRKLFQVDAASLFLSEGDRTDMRIYRAKGLSDDYIRSISIDLTSPLAEKLVAGRRPAEIYDASGGAVSGQKKLLRSEGITSLLMAPILTGNDMVGVLVLYSKTPRHFTDSELNFSVSLAEQASIAFANAKLHSNLQKVSNEIEQTRNLMLDGLVVLSDDFKLRYYNPSAATILGIDDTRDHRPESSSAFDEIVAAITKAKASNDYRATGEPMAVRSSFSRTISGRVRSYEAVISPYRDTDGGMVGWLANIRDTTVIEHQRDQLAIVQDNMLDGLLVIDAEARASEHNGEWANLFPAGSFETGVKPFEILAAHPDITFDRNVIELVHDVLGGKQLTCYVNFVRLGRHLQLSFGPVHTSGSITGAIVTARDITPLIEKTIEANEMAAKAQRHLRELSQLAELSSIIGFNVTSIYQKYLSKIATLLVSPSVAIYLYEPASQSLKLQDGPSGRSTHENPDELKLDDEHPAAQAFVQRRGVDVSGADSHCFAMPIVHHSKTLGVVIVRRTTSAYDEHDGKLLRLVATRLAVLIENSSLYHDVNARRERWEAVFRFTEEGIIIFDRDGHIVGFNPAAEEITQFKVGEAIGKPFEDIVRPSAGAGVLGPSPLTKVLGEGVTIAKSEQLIDTSGGSRLWTEISYSPIFDDAGRVTSGIAIIRNTQKDREIEEIKSDFISIVSHELRTPLTAIKGFLSMVLKNDFGPLGDKQAHYLGRVYQSNQRMINLVEDLLDVSYIESGKINLTINPVAIESVISEVVSELSGKAAANGIKLKVKQRTQLPQVLADESRLHQIALNIIDNAVKYSGPDTTVIIDCSVQGDELVTTVTDQGVGISRGQIDRLFTKFGRIYNPMSVQAGGSGLGLYITKNLIESHGGQIWVTSQEGKGSKFRFSMPVARQLPLLGETD